MGFFVLFSKFTKPPLIICIAFPPYFQSANIYGHQIINKHFHSSLPLNSFFGSRHIQSQTAHLLSVSPHLNRMKLLLNFIPTREWVSMNKMTESLCKFIANILHFREFEKWQQERQTATPQINDFIGWMTSAIEYFIGHFIKAASKQ